MTNKPLGALLLHGFSAGPMNVAAFEAPIQSLGLPTRRPALRGHAGSSPDSLRGVTWQDWIDDALAATQELSEEADKVIIIGHSMGGLTALNLAAERPDVVDSLVLVAAAIRVSAPFSPGTSLNFLTPLVGKVLDRINFSPKVSDPERMIPHKNYTWVPIEAVLSFFDYMKVTQKRLGEVFCPTLLLNSRRDSTVPEKAAYIIYDNLATSPDQKRIQWFEHTDHEMCLDCEREAVVAAGIEFTRQRQLVNQLVTS